MTRAELNTDIDANITDVVAVDGITPEILGDQLKVIADYVDERTLIKVQKTTITEAQILQLFTTPIAVLESTTAGIAKIPLNILCKRSGAGTNYTISTNQFKLSAASTGGTFSLSLFNTILTGAIPVSYVNFSANASSQIGSGSDDETYLLGCYTSDPTGGTGNMDVFVTYIEIPIT